METNERGTLPSLAGLGGIVGRVLPSTQVLGNFRGGKVRVGCVALRLAIKDDADGRTPSGSSD